MNCASGAILRVKLPRSLPSRSPNCWAEKWSASLSRHAGQCWGVTSGLYGPGYRPALQVCPDRACRGVAVLGVQREINCDQFVQPALAWLDPVLRGQVIMHE